jgi:hypothetical protein
MDAFEARLLAHADLSFKLENLEHLLRLVAGQDTKARADIVSEVLRVRRAKRMLEDELRRDTAAAGSKSGM